VTRVLVAAASAVTRAGLEAILIREPTLTVVGETASPSSLVEEVAAQEPDVVLLEIVDHLADAIPMLRILGVDADERSRAAPAIVLLLDDEDGSHVVELLDSGARAILPRAARAAEIVAAVNAAAAGLVALAPEFGRKAWNAEEGASKAAAVDNGTRETLSGRELEVLRLVAEGLANKQIAARLGISEHTVKFHIGSVFTKIGASTRAEAVMIGARRGLIVL